MRPVPRNRPPKPRQLDAFRQGVADALAPADFTINIGSGALVIVESDGKLVVTSPGAVLSTSQVRYLHRELTRWINRKRQERIWNDGHA